METATNFSVIETIVHQGKAVVSSEDSAIIEWAFKTITEGRTATPRLAYRIPTKHDSVKVVVKYEARLRYRAKRLGYSVMLTRGLENRRHEASGGRSPRWMTAALPIWEATTCRFLMLTSRVGDALDK